ncbi:diguanylate cyclase (GGDEF)-like protein [Bacillus thermophilus]|uniref:Diguanylate cyclase (GGDEF)-like protein n=1 Tax=Siminovitchia thermophila TaxID=1245522 RepID=A0ABS2R3E6_9BACI|nr:GGDEF domain-containing protein [Siminovitchia thermophila]MBM7714119.1 diguanylate cyclase (GGDEF)-like protein [Siminovitchia thermophila]
MNNNFRLHLTFIMIIFSIFISFVVALLNQNNLKNTLFEAHKLKLEMVEDNILSSLNTIDKAYMLFDKNIAKDMEDKSKVLLGLYQQNPDFRTWDFTSLKKQIGMDIYIINNENVIIHSSYEPDIGLDFRKCCAEFANLLNIRRNEGTFVDDGLDIQQTSGEVKKFSYIPTPDRKYILQLGVSLENGEIFKQFNYFDAEVEIENKFSIIDSIRIFNNDGYVIGRNDQTKEDITFSSDNWEAFKSATKTRKSQEVKGRYNGRDVTYRYVPYAAESARGYSTSRVVEIIYNEDDLHEALSKSRNKFFSQMLIIFTGAIIISMIIARWMARPMYLAFHDSLTGLKNRAAFEEIVKQKLSSKKQNLALMMIDLDNFKLVNDRLGHLEGDQILKMAAYRIQRCVGKSHESTRLGGDEFAVIISGLDENEIIFVASSLIKDIDEQFGEIRFRNQIDISVSIGIAFADSEDDLASLYEKADRALYESKENGKNQFQIFQKTNEAGF